MSDACRFCLANGLLTDAPLYQNEAFYVLGQLTAARQASVMVIPLRHLETPFELAAQEWSAMEDALQFARDHLQPQAPDGFTIGWNVGAVAGQHVMHAHLHVICRFAGQPASDLGLHGLIAAVNATED